MRVARVHGYCATYKMDIFFFTLTSIIPVQDIIPYIYDCIFFPAPPFTLTGTLTKQPLEKCFCGRDERLFLCANAFIFPSDRCEY